ncbi:MAG: CBS domain-containing protein [archaeon]
MKSGIIAKEIMEEEFPIIDSTISLEKVVKSLGRNHEACVVLRNGYFCTVLGFEDLLRGFMNRKHINTSLDEIQIEKKFKIVGPGKDVVDILEIMNKSNAEFILVRDKQNILGLITKKDIMEIEPLLFEGVELDEFE